MRRNQAGRADAEARSAVPGSIRKRFQQLLGRLLRPGTVLLVVLCFAFAEPLACIAHCQLYQPGLPQHRHAHVHAAPHGLALAATAGWCFYATGSPASPPAVVPPSPVHDLVVAGVLALGALALLLFLPMRRPSLGAPGGIAPPTPPPRLVGLPL